MLKGFQEAAMSVGLLSEAVLFSQEFLPAPHRPAVAATSGCPAGPHFLGRVKTPPKVKFRESMLWPA